MIKNNSNNNKVNFNFYNISNKEIIGLLKEKSKNNNNFFDSLLIFLIKKKIKKINIYSRYISHLENFFEDNYYKHLVKITLNFSKKNLPKDCINVTNSFINNKSTIFNLNKYFFLKNFFWPKLNIVVPNLNHAKYIKRTIFSITDQNYPNYKIFFIDGNSNDNSHSVIKNLKKKFNIELLIRKDEDVFEGLNFFFRKRLIPQNEFVGILSNTDVFLNYSLLNIGAEILKNSNCAAIGAAGKFISDTAYKPNFKNKKNFFFKFKKKYIYNLKMLPCGQFFFYKFFYLIKSKYFSIKGCHTNTFILIILNALKNNKDILITKSFFGAHIFHHDHSPNFYKSRGLYIHESRKELINEIRSKKLINVKEITKLSNEFLKSKIYYYFSNGVFFNNDIKFFFKNNNLLEIFILALKIIIDKFVYLKIRFIKY